ncbi:hypothetical protein [Pseudomonas reinekei]
MLLLKLKGSKACRHPRRSLILDFLAIANTSLRVFAALQTIAPAVVSKFGLLSTGSTAQTT